MEVEILAAVDEEADHRKQGEKPQRVVRLVGAAADIPVKGWQGGKGEGEEAEHGSGR